MDVKGLGAFFRLHLPEFSLRRSTRMRHPHNTHPVHLVLKWFGALLHPRKDWQNDLSIVCFYTLQAWWDGNLPDGTAGSEEAVVYMARALANLGWNVTVFNNCLKTRRIGQVTYVPLAHYNPYQRCDTTILWRSAQPLSHSRRCRNTYLWLHDVASPAEWPKGYAQHLSKAIVLSQFHRNVIPALADDKVCISRNGFSKPARGYRLAYVLRDRDVRRCIYASGPTRGLECLLKLWPAIRARVADATLAVHYGWADLDWKDPQSADALTKKARFMELLDQPGILTKNERLSLDDLWDAFSTSGVWIYPTQFMETSCITAMRAQAAGAIPVVTGVAALRETVQWGTAVVGEDIYTNEDTQRAFVDAVVEQLLRPREDLRAAMMQWAQGHWDWNDVAREWTREFQSAAQDYQPSRRQERLAKVPAKYVGLHSSREDA